MIQEPQVQPSQMVPEAQRIENPHRELTQKLDAILAKNPFELNIEEIQFVARATQRTKEECVEVAKRGAAKMFIRLLQTRNEEIIEQVFYVVGNITTDSQEHGEEIAINGGMQDIFMITQRLKQKTNLFRLGLWTLSNLIRTNADFSFIAPIIRYFCELIVNQEVPNYEVLQDCIAAIWAQRRNNKDEIIKKIQIIIETNLISKLLNLLHHYSKRLVSLTLKLLVRISMGSEEQTEYFLSYGVIREVSFMLGNSSFSARESVCYLYFNIIADSEKQAVFFLEHEEIIQNLLVMLKCDSVSLGVKIASIFSFIMRYDLGDQTFSKLFGQRKLLIYYAELILRCEAILELEYMELVVTHLYNLFKNCSGSYLKFVHVRRAVRTIDFWGLLKRCEGLARESLKSVATKFLQEYENVIRQQYLISNEDMEESKDK